MQEPQGDHYLHIKNYRKEEAIVSGSLPGQLEVWEVFEYLSGNQYPVFCLKFVTLISVCGIGNR